MKKLLILLLAQVFYLNAEATSTIAIMNGNWNEGTIWTNGAPGCFDTIIIPFGITVNVGTTADLTGCANDSILVYVAGTLSFTNGRKLKLPCDSDVFVAAGGSIEPDGGGGNSNYIEICSDIYWNAGAGTVTGPSSFCDGGCPGTGSPLPIKLVYFTGEMKGRDCYLNWKTASESEFDYFTLQKSADGGSSWIDLEQIKGAGNSSVPTYYSAIDNNVLDKEVYYRLRQTDIDKTVEYSIAIKVSQTLDNAFFIYPNPTEINGKMVVQVPASGSVLNSIDVYTVEGRKVFTMPTNTLESNRYEIDLGSFAKSGYYLVRFGDKSLPLIVK